MRRDPTSYSSSGQKADGATARGQMTKDSHAALLREARLLGAMVIGALLIALAYQIPVTHVVDVGGYDSAYVQGFYDPERAGPNASKPYLDGSDGGARWARDTSYLLFPQAGLPAQVTLRLRGPDSAPRRFTVLLNGAVSLGSFQAGAGWQDYTFTIDGGLLKPNDVVIAIRSDTAQIDPDDPRAVGVLLDRATYRVGPAPVVPYPPQLLYGALAAGMLYVLTVRGYATGRQPDWPRLRIWLAGVVALAVAFLALYRAQMPYPYPLLRLLPAVDAALLALLALRHGPALARRAPALLDAAAVGGIGVWAAAVLVAAQRHVTLSTPGAEADFRVFALRSAHLAGSFPAGTSNPDLDGVFRADGFYNLGYPLLLWLARPLASDNPFLAARLVAALSATLLLGAGWWLARRLLGRGPALVALLALALSPLVVQHGLLLGTDTPFAALCALALALLVSAMDDGRRTIDDGRSHDPIAHRRSSVVWVLAGLACGAAFLVRHPGALLLPLGWLAIFLNAKCGMQNAKNNTPNSRSLPRFFISHFSFFIPFTLAFLLTILPQVVVNVRDTGQPLYNEQAKNVWQAVFGAGDWGRWGEAANSIGVGQVIAQDPGRFLANWWANVRGFFGTGGEDTREFGQALQLRLLGFPVNWLAVAGLIGWLVTELKRQNAKCKMKNDETFAFYIFPFSLLLLWIVLYVASVSVGLALQPRFVLPLAPVYAVAAAWAVAWLGRRGDEETFEESQARPYISRFTLYISRNAPLLAGTLLIPLLWGGFVTGTEYVLRSRPANEPVLARAENRAEQPGQPADEVAIIELVRATLRPGERLIVRADPRSPLGKYSAIAHLTVPALASDDPAALRATGAQYLIWSSALGPAPKAGEQVGAAGIYTLYRITP